MPLLEITPDGIASNANPLTLTFQFSKVVTGFGAGDVLLSNGSACTFTAVDGDTFTLRVTPTSDGPVSVSVPANAAVDAGGNGNTSDSATVISDRTAPVLTITPNGNVTPASPIQFTVQFTEPVTGFEMGDISLTSGSVNAFTAIDGDTYELQVAPAADGMVTINVPADATSDAAGNKSSSGSAAITSDRTVPTVTINQAAGQVDPTIVEPIHFTAVFSEPVSGFTDADVTLAGTAVGPFTVVVTGTGPTYDVAVSGMRGGGTVIASINAGIAFDAAGNGNSASTSTDNVVLFDANKPPAITSPAAVSVPENSTTVMTVTATDADLPPQSIAFSIIGGADQDKSTISGDGVLKFKAAPDFESPTDSDGNNVYVVEVKADDGNGGTATQTTSITVTNATAPAVIDRVLFVDGSTTADSFTVSVEPGGMVRIVQTVASGPGAETRIPAVMMDTIVVIAGSGNDTIFVSQNVALPTFIDGGAGSDFIRGTNQSNLIPGGPGNDQIHGGNARDVLIGGEGSDTVYGYGEDDLMIGVNVNNTRDELLAIRAAWIANQTFAARSATARSMAKSVYAFGSNVLIGSTGSNLILTPPAAGAAGAALDDDATTEPTALAAGESSSANPQNPWLAPAAHAEMLAAIHPLIAPSPDRPIP